MAEKQISLKKVGVDKTNSRTVLVTSIASFVVVFSIVASISLFHQLVYQNKVIAKKKVAVTQLKQNVTNTDKLVNSYKQFVTTPQNVLGGDPNGNGPKDGNNAKIVLDALPSTYDFPALASSLEKIMTDQGVLIMGMNGTDDEVAQSSAADSASPAPVEIPFEITVAGSYDSVKNAVGAMERSIRPIQVDKLELSGDQNQLNATITAKTYYQPEKALSIKTEVVK